MDNDMDVVIALNAKPHSRRLRCMVLGLGFRSEVEPV